MSQKINSSYTMFLIGLKALLFIETGLFAIFEVGLHK